MNKKLKLKMEEFMKNVPDNTPKGFTRIKGDANYWLDAVRDFWADTRLDIDAYDLEEIVNWFDKRREHILK